MSSQESKPTSSSRRTQKKKTKPRGTITMAQQKPLNTAISNKPGQTRTKNSAKKQASPLSRGWLWLKQTLAGMLSASPKQKNGTLKTGVVKFFNRAKGFGFILEDNGAEVYVHISALKSSIRENDKVTFETQQGKKGLTAVHVTVIE